MGKQEYTRITRNCPAGTPTTKTENCCYVGDWYKKSSGCDNTGKQVYLRTVKNCDSSVKNYKRENCCFTGNWMKSGYCKSNAKQNYTRAVINCPANTQKTKEEDCCLIGPWVAGGCSSAGKRTYTRKLDGPCPANTQKTREENCCFEGYWKASGGCKSNGKQTFTRTPINCPANTQKTKEEECCYTGPFKKVDGCSSNGKQKYTRAVFNCPTGTTSERFGDCCYIGNWEKSGSCVKGRQSYIRTVTSWCPQGTPSTKAEACCYIGEWKDKNGVCDGKNGTQERVVTPACPPGTAKNQQVVTKQCEEQVEAANLIKASETRALTQVEKNRIGVIYGQNSKRARDAAEQIKKDEYERRKALVLQRKEEKRLADLKRACDMRTWNGVQLPYTQRLIIEKDKEYLGARGVRTSDHPRAATIIFIDVETPKTRNPRASRFIRRSSDYRKDISKIKTVVKDSRGSVKTDVEGQLVMYKGKLISRTYPGDVWGITGPYPNPRKPKYTVLADFKNTNTKTALVATWDDILFVQENNNDKYYSLSNRKEIDNTQKCVLE
jgi:hypothetical protein